MVKNDGLKADLRTHHKKRKKIVYRRLAIQTSVILVHVLLIKVAIPNLLWAILGLVFWGGLIIAAMKSGRWVCASFCWLGGIQDLMYRWAKKRVHFSPMITQSIILAIAVLWVPIAWLLVDNSVMSDKGNPINNPFNAEENIWVQGGHFMILMLVGLTVTVFGPRGGCHYLCPFGMIVTTVRRHKLNIQNKKAEVLTPKPGFKI